MNTNEDSDYLKVEAKRVLEESRSGKLPASMVKAQVSVLNVYEKAVKIQHANREWDWRIGEMKAKPTNPKAPPGEPKKKRLEDYPDDEDEDVDDIVERVAARREVLKKNR